MAPVGDTDRPAQAEAALGEVQPVAHRSSDAVVGHPPDEGGVQAAGEDEVLDQVADLVVGQRRDNGAAQAERAA